MKKKNFAIMLSICAALSLAACTGANTEKENKADTPKKVVLEAKDAELNGVTLKDTENEKAISYDEQDDCIIGIGEFSTASYTVPEETVEGEYDIYLNVSKGSTAFVAGSTPVMVKINDGENDVPSIPVVPCSMEQMGMRGNPTYQQDMGVFKIETDVTLKANDEITISGVAGNEFIYDGNPGSSMPAIGDVVLYPTGESVKQGYEDNKFEEKKEEKDTSDSLSGLDIAWLGSSVTYGQAAQGYSMADEIAANHSATTSYKYTISGTTLADCKTASSLPTDGNGSHGSYVERLKQLDTSRKYDLFIVQLSTNDATAGIPMGEISKSKELSDQDTATVIGAMEYIIAYVEENWDCPVMFYTGTKYDSEQYAQMVDDLLKLQEKWGIGVIDLWNDAEMNAVTPEQYTKYMKEDGVHPLRDGYVEWWTPKFEEAITSYIESR
ncbi:hypothetical protein I230019B6_29100 [Firmicutes bacterium i23-0019-B6]